MVKGQAAKKPEKKADQSGYSDKQDDGSDDDWKVM